MKINNEVKELFEKMPFYPLATMGKDGPHLIVLAQGFIIDVETLAFFGWRQSRTSENIEENGVMQIVVVAGEKNKGFRLEGKGRIEREGEIFEELNRNFPEQLGKLSFATVMKVEKVESLL
jgi:predicted pyridoxine 5'-phosphate oxidase superfamily flavin-nucleotide-binding protein